MGSSLIAPAAQKVFVHAEKITPANVTTKDGSQVFVWEARSVAALPREPRSPGITEISPYVHVSTVGDNLPNENQIREKYGSKSFLFTGSSRTLRQGNGFGALEEFAASPEEIAVERVANLAGQIAHTSMSVDAGAAAGHPRCRTRTCR